jgi:tRNA pseudouridine38-40 synthase
LPASLAVVAADEVAPDFSARCSARGKHYRYTVLCRADRSPLAARTAWFRSRPLDRAAMIRAANHLLGEHDFTSFRAADCSAQTARRRITHIDISPGEWDQLFIDVYGNAFLRKMVRIVAGTLVAVGQGQLAAETIPEIIAARDRACAGPTAPACGLTLVGVSYPPTSAP